MKRLLAIAGILAAASVSAQTVPVFVPWTSCWVRWDGGAAISGGGTTPTGTGFTHITAGVQDAAAKLVDTADVNNSQITLAKIANAAANSKLVGSGAAGVGAAYSELTLGTNLSMSGTTLNATIGGSVPTGTGFRHITAGAEDAASKLVDTADVNNSQITYAKMQNSSVGLTTIGRSVNSSGIFAEIAATAASDAVFRESGSVLGFGTIATAGIANAAVTYAKVQNGGPLSVAGRSANSSGVMADIPCTAASDAVLRESGSVLGCGTIATAGIANSAVTLPKLANQAANTWVANTTSSSNPPTAITIPTCSDTVGQHINYSSNAFSCGTSVGTVKKPVSITLENPTSAENIGVMRTPDAITITRVSCVLVGSASPSVTPNFKFGSDRSAAGTSVTTSPSAVTSTTTGDTETINNSAVSADNWIWFVTTAQSGTVTQMTCTLDYTKP